MPAQDGLGGDEERCPALLRDEPRQGGDDRPIGPGEAGTCDLTAKDRNLVAQHEDLGVVGSGVHVVDGQDLKDATDQAVEEAERHRSARSLFTTCLVKSAIKLLDPSGLLPPRTWPSQPAGCPAPGCPRRSRCHWSHSSRSMIRQDAVGRQVLGRPAITGRGPKASIGGNRPTRSNRPSLGATGHISDVACSRRYSRRYGRAKSTYPRRTGSTSSAAMSRSRYWLA